MTRIMGDSTTMADIPTSVEIVGVYINGEYGVESQAQLDARFPHSKYGQVFIDVNGSRPDADARDFETGDKGGNLESWVADHNNHAGKKNAVIYCNVSTIPEVRQQTGNQILNKDYFLWIATLDGSEYTGEGVIACQKDGEKQTGGHWDRSVVYDDSFWRPTGSPVSSPKPAAKPNCQPFQRAVHTLADNQWGIKTDNHALAVERAFEDKFPFGISYTQSVIGTAVDGDWGLKSKAALRVTTKNVQTALKNMGFNPGTIDGAWGPKTQTAYDAAQKACHI